VTSAVLLAGECTGRRSSLPSRIVESRTLFSRARGIEKMSAIKDYPNTNTSENCSKLARNDSFLTRNFGINLIMADLFELN